MEDLMEKRPKYLFAESPFYGFAIWVLAILLSAAIGCEKKEDPIKVGFVGGLTGRLSDLGTAGRNGVILAVEEINSSGGINGRPVRLIIKDDKQNPEVTLRVDRELVDEGVVAIIGHMTSSMSMVAVPFVNKQKILMISPTTSTNKVTGIDDYFIRMMPPNKSETYHLARHAFKVMGLKKMAAIYDLSNRAYTEGYLNNFRNAFESLGGKIIYVETFTSGKNVDFVKSADSLLKPGPEGVLIVTGGPDAAMISQRIRMTGSKVPIFSCGWAMTADFIHDGGPAVEGVVLSTLFDRKSRQKAYLEFRERFEKRFGDTPDFAAANGYEAAFALFKALSKNADPQELKATILQQDTFEGLQGDFKVDQYGDPQRKRFLVTVLKGQFKAAENVQK
jgi:branched-chain amino acid transport system substrate-binding protein